MALHPTSELVAIAWLTNVPGMPAGACATTIPDQEKWPVGDDGISRFVSVRTVGGSPPRSQAPTASPVIEVKCWATRLLSDKPPWSAANQLCEIIRIAMYARALGVFGQPLIIAPGNKQYSPATVTGVTMTMEPRRIYSDPRNYAVYSFDMNMNWKESGILIP